MKPYSDNLVFKYVPAIILKVIRQSYKKTGDYNSIFPDFDGFAPNPPANDIL